eukprot:3194735-Lingulodinium_polyedra.AAC.1
MAGRQAGTRVYACIASRRTTPHHNTTQLNTPHFLGPDASRRWATVISARATVQVAQAAASKQSHVDDATGEEVADNQCSSNQLQEQGSNITLQSV